MLGAVSQNQIFSGHSLYESLYWNAGMEFSSILEKSYRNHQFFVYTRKIIIFVVKFRVWPNMVYLDLLRYGYDVYVGSIKDKEVDFVAIKNDRIIYVQATYMLVDDKTIEREYAPLECIADNYEKIVVSLDDLQLPSRNGIRHVRAWELAKVL